MIECDDCKIMEPVVGLFLSQSELKSKRLTIDGSRFAGIVEHDSTIDAQHITMRDI